MDIMELGAIGELVGGVAVVASLLYVGSQVRQGNRNEQTSAERHFTTEWNHTILGPWEDPGKAELLRRAHRSFLTLEGQERANAHAYWTKVVILGQQVRQHQQQGRFDARLAEAIQQALTQCIKCPGAAEWWSTASATFTPAYADWLSDRCASPSSPSFEETLPWLVAEREGEAA